MQYTSLSALISPYPWIITTATPTHRTGDEGGSGRSAAGEGPGPGFGEGNTEQKVGDLCVLVVRACRHLLVSGHGCESSGQRSEGRRVLPKCWFRLVKPGSSASLMQNDLIARLKELSRSRPCSDTAVSDSADLYCPSYQPCSTAPRVASPAKSISSRLLALFCALLAGR